MNSVFLVTLALGLVFLLSWGLTVGIIKLITMCFGWHFSFGIATGIWLCLCLARTVFKNNTK